jgi:hypothetical protein
MDRWRLAKRAEFRHLSGMVQLIAARGMGIFKNLGYFLLPLPLAAGALAEEKSVRIGYTQCSGQTVPPQQASDKASQLKWYFAHASVGANMVDGLNDLKKTGNGSFWYTTFFCDKTPPTQTEAGTVYEHNRGNPGWKAKFDQFASDVSNGWHFPKVDVVMNKLCYIDQLASFRYYIHSMTNLEAAFPDTVFVYMTMPLMTDEDADNGLRNGFNDRVREWTKANGRVLFDIADIEAHDSKGQMCTFTRRNRTCQKLCADYTGDGGHLNESGRQLVARGFYALAAALEERKSKTAAAAGR